MRFFIRQARAALVPAILCSIGIARGQDYSLLQPVANQYSDSYYAQNPSQRTAQSSYFTGVTEEQSSHSDVAATAAPAPAGAWGSCDTCCDTCCNDVGTWRDNTLFSFGGEAYKSLGDTFPAPVFDADYMNSAGLVGTFNTGFALWSLERVRGQIGGSYGVYDFKGRDTASFSSSEQQTFLTLGVYKRSDVSYDDRLAWGAVYDQFWAHQWGRNASELYVGQVRGLLGWATSEWNEFGVWAAFRTTSDSSVFGVAPPVRAQNQYNFFWRHNFDFGGQTMLYIGGHDPADIGSWLFGALGQAPLNDYLGLYGNFVFSQPSSATGIVGSNEQEWAFGAGLTYYFGGKAASPNVSGPQGLPLLPVANNGSFLITN
jgi:hypothetical protein